VYKMAANYTTLNYSPSSNQPPFYNHQQQPSPTDSATATPHNISPASPRMETCMKYQVPSHVRQLRPPKSPLYVPAALRPTERPVRQSPMTPPKSLRDSFDSLEQADFDGGIPANVAPPFDLVIQQGLFSEEDLGEVTGPPNKTHWKVSNININICEHPYTTSRHHASCLGCLQEFYALAPLFAMTCNPFPLDTRNCFPSQQAILMYTFCSPMKLLRLATRPGADPHSIYLYGSITAAIAATFSVPSTPLIQFLLIKMPSSTQRACSLAHATAATSNIRDGKPPGVCAVRTATAATLKNQTASIWAVRTRFLCKCQRSPPSKWQAACRRIGHGAHSESWLHLL
jgi:hypothetical protein